MHQTLSPANPDSKNLLQEMHRAGVRSSLFASSIQRSNREGSVINGRLSWIISNLSAVSPSPVSNFITISGEREFYNSIFNEIGMDKIIEFSKLFENFNQVAEKKLK